ncbi:GNAT family N-acetyltransferase [Jeotgalibacillus soli]|uniref:N-acetyltransferase domain-containing protein n=1 Tax=Jeotgalibacillus soli TaxID=889306 RepID=A0A0C2VL97_9BACL|nr:GNAT family protein [Jeotgalibacillus soli]KIL49682.1 hypothetical protein KP78_11500 [Jeotgalibacillus soli]
MKIEDIYGSFTTIETERTLIRPIKLSDVDDIYTYGSVEEVTRYVTWNTYRSKEDVRVFLDYVFPLYEQKKLAPWAIELKEIGKMVGTADFVNWSPAHKKAEIGYVLSSVYWGAGIVPEAAAALLKFGFEQMELERIQARCFEENKASERVMQKIGMTYEGTLRNEMYVKGVHRNMKMYAILRDEFFNE